MFARLRLGRENMKMMKSWRYLLLNTNSLFARPSRPRVHIIDRLLVSVGGALGSQGMPPPYVEIYQDGQKIFDSSRLPRRGDTRRDGLETAKGGTAGGNDDPAYETDADEDHTDGDDRDTVGWMEGLLLVDVGLPVCGDIQVQLSATRMAIEAAEAMREPDESSGYDGSLAGNVAAASGVGG